VGHVRDVGLAADGRQHVLSDLFVVCHKIASFLFLKSNANIFIAPLRTRPDETKKKTLKRRAETQPTNAGRSAQFLKVMPPELCRGYNPVY
jgi:hypothetical protein